MIEADLIRLRKELKLRLSRLYENRLTGLYIFGSYARGEADEESDLDILIVLTDYRRYGEEIERTGEIISELSLKYGVSISRKIVSEKRWIQSDSALLRNIHTESIPA